MGIELARAFVAVRADTSRVGSDIQAARPGIESAVGGLVSSIGGMRGALMGLVGVGSAIGAVFKAGKFEQTTIAFETMMGSASETKDTLERLTEFAAKTPFEMPEIEQAARGLIMFGERGDELMKTLNTLGNAASGTSTPFGMLALIFNQVRGVGKLLTQDFRQLSTRGVMSLADIAKYYKVTTAEAQKMLSTGRISFEDLKKILESLSEKGGRFENLMERQSTSLLGLWSTLKDAIGITARQIGMVLLPTAKDFVSIAIQATEAVRNWVQEHKNLVTLMVQLAEVWIGYKMAIYGARTAMIAYHAIASAAVGIRVGGSAIKSLLGTAEGTAKGAGETTSGRAAGTSSGCQR